MAEMRQKWLTIVGIGEDGLAGLGERARDAIRSAEIVYGGARHLALAGAAIRGERRQWPSPFDQGLRDIAALRGSCNVCVLASGDPFFHGVGASLARTVDAGEMHVIPQPSAFSLAAARLGWPLQSVEQVSLHGHAIDLIRPLLHPGRRVLALTSDGRGPAALASLLGQNGFENSTITVLEALGGERERLTRGKVSEFDPSAEFDPLNVVAIEVVASADARVLPLGAGLADDLFEHDGQITKRAQRAITLSALAPRRGELLWDIGSGSGSVAIAWMLCEPSMRAISIEQHAERAARIARNAAGCGVPGLGIVEGRAPGALDGLEAPDAVFIGGGGSGEGVLDAALAALRPGGRLVANAVTLEMESTLLASHARLGGELTRLALAHAEPVGSMQGWRPAMPLTQWSWVKPW